MKHLIILSIMLSTLSGFSQEQKESTSSKKEVQESFAEMKAEMAIWQQAMNEKLKAIRDTTLTEERKEAFQVQAQIYAEAIAKHTEAMARQMEKWTPEMEAWAKENRPKLEAWAEEFGKEMEEWAEDFSREMEAWARENDGDTAPEPQSDKE